MFEHNCVPTQDADGEEIPIDGSSDETPIQLGGLASVTLRDAELELICKTIYDMPLTSSSELTTHEAISLLYTSTKFQFEGIHKKTVERLENELLPLQRYVLAIDCLVDPWLLRAYIEFCSLADYPLTHEYLTEFSRRNGSKMFLELLKAREEYRTKLLVYTFGRSRRPYSGDSKLGEACSSCLPALKNGLRDILSADGTSSSEGVNRNLLPFLRDRLIREILDACSKCRLKEQAVIAQMLEIDGLEKEVKKLLFSTPS
ncbi:hypothetical protein FRC07_008111 [Ceratobasidium sp. 392]|nr:hypothetical protein FRC07_008111 [Ceratobasidium sp. 392]